MYASEATYGADNKEGEIGDETWAKDRKDGWQMYGSTLCPCCEIVDSPPLLQCSGHRC